MRRRTTSRGLLLAVALVGLLAAGCRDGAADDPVVADAESPASPALVTSPPVAGPRPKTVFQHIRELGVRPGSVDEFLIRDLLMVADSQYAHRAATGAFGSLEEVKATRDYRLRGGRVVLVSGDGDAGSFCLRAFVNEEDVRVWFYDTDRVLPRGEFCA